MHCLFFIPSLPVLATGLWTVSRNFPFPAMFLSAVRFVYLYFSVPPESLHSPFLSEWQAETSTVWWNK